MVAIHFLPDKNDPAICKQLHTHRRKFNYRPTCSILHACIRDVSIKPTCESFLSSVVKLRGDDLKTQIKR